MAKPLFTRRDMGCIADGTLGHQHCRERLADALCALYEHARSTWTHARIGETLDTITSLRSEMPDDARDEYDAIERLNTYTADGLVWEFVDGDLMLRESSDD